MEFVSERLPGTLGSQHNLWGSSSLPRGKSQAPISKEAFLKGLWNIKGPSLCRDEVKNKGVIFLFKGLKPLGSQVQGGKKHLWFIEIKLQEVAEGYKAVCSTYFIPTVCTESSWVFSGYIRVCTPKRLGCQEEFRIEEKSNGNNSAKWRLHSSQQPTVWWVHAHH